MQNTHDLDRLGQGLVDLIGFLNSPQRDDALLREAGVRLDRALFPLLVHLGRRAALSVSELADLAGRDHTTISRQVARLETLGLIAREADAADRRRRAAQLTPEGAAIVEAISAARRRLLSRALADWSGADLRALADLNQRFTGDLAALARAAVEGRVE